MISVVIPVRDRPSIYKVINKLFENESLIQCEIIVIVNSWRNNREASQLHNYYYKRKNLRIICVEKEIFNKSVLLNIGIYNASCEFVLSLDADIIIDPSYLKYWIDNINKNKAFSPDMVIETFNGVKRPAPGIIFFSKEKALEINGYSSDFIDWGFEDLDFIHRLKLNSVELINYGDFFHLSHGEDIRTRFHFEKNRRLARRKNSSLFRERQSQEIINGTLIRDVFENKNSTDELA